MKVLLRVITALLAVGAAVMGLQFVASETGEVVVLSTRGADGGTEVTRLWVIDHQQHQWLRSGTDNAGWKQRLDQTPELTLERDGKSARYRAVLSPGDTATINQLMADKYGWRNTYVGWLFPRDNAVAIKLEPIAPG